MEWLDRLQTLAIAMLPAAIVAALLVALDPRSTTERVRQAAFAAGIFCAPIAMGWQILAARLYSEFGGSALTTDALFVLMGFSLPQEALKLAALIFIVLSQPEAAVGRDSAVAGAWLGLGAGLADAVLRSMTGGLPLVTSLLFGAPTLLFSVALGAIVGSILQRRGIDRGWWFALGLATILQGWFSWPVSTQGQHLIFTTSAGADATIHWMGVYLASSILLCVPVVSSIRTSYAIGGTTLPRRYRWAKRSGYVAAAASALVGLGLAGLAAFTFFAGDPRGWVFFCPAILPLAFAILWWRARPLTVPAASAT
jgi:hypothetical protein